MLRQQVGEDAQLASRTKGNGARLTMRQHGTASGPRASAGFDESLPARQSAQTNALVLQKVVAGVNQRIITLTLALGQLDRQMHDTMRSEHTPRECCGGGAVDFRADEG